MYKGRPGSWNGQRIAAGQVTRTLPVVCCLLYVERNTCIAQDGVAIFLSFVVVVKDDQETCVKRDL